jgi:hypothetical protein
VVLPLTESDADPTSITFPKIDPPHSNMDNLPHNDGIELAIADVESKSQPNYAAAAAQHS